MEFGVCQRAAEDGFAADIGPSLETGAVLDAALSGNDRTDYGAGL